jgi:tetratricopeptide (TPR) repeat protein
MIRPIRWLWLLPVLVAAGPAVVPPDELVRRGNRAQTEQKYVDALRLYDQAQERTTDPGMVAFNEGVAFYQQGDYVRAESHFRMARQDAVGRRRLGADYDLACSLVQTAGDRDVRKLAEAIGLFEECLRQVEPDNPLAADARHNLELAKFTWLLARARPDSHKDKPPEDSEEPKQPPPPKPEPNKQPGGDDGSGNPTKGSGDRERGQEQGKQAVSEQGDAAPGEGTLPVIPDREEMVPMSRDEAEAHLRQAIERVLQERRAHGQRSVRVPAGKVRDW